MDVLSRPPEVFLPPELMFPGDANVPSFDSSPPTLPATRTPPPAANTIQPPPPRRRSGASLLAFAAGIVVAGVALEGSKLVGGEALDSGVVPAVAPIDAPEAPEQVEAAAEFEGRVIETRSAAVVFPEAERRPASEPQPYTGGLDELRHEPRVAEEQERSSADEMLAASRDDAELHDDATPEARDDAKPDGRAEPPPTRARGDAEPKAGPFLMQLK